MPRFRKSILILGILIAIIAASLGTALALYATGAIKTDPVELVYAVDPAEKIYDGTPLKADGYELKSGKLANGHTARVEYLGAQTNVGSSLSDMAVKIYDTEGYNVTSQYSIKVIGARLSVYPKPISVTMPDQKVIYNGSKVDFEKYEINEEENGGLVSGHKICGSAEASLVNVGDKLPDTLTPLVFDAAGNDVTENYNISFSVGDIQVLPRQISVRPVSLTKTYDGLELKSSQIEYLNGSLADGQYAKWEINYGTGNTLLDVDVTETQVTSFKVYEVVNGEEVEVTQNYEISTFEKGTLEVTKRALTVTAKSAEWTYDGEEHSLRGDEQPLAVEGLADGDRIISVAYIGAVTNAETVVNKISEITLSCPYDNYEITVIDGTLTVKRLQIEIVTESDEKYYDGEPLSANWRPTLLANEGHTIAVAAGSTQPQITNAGSISNQYECAVKDENQNDVTGNYSISYKYGTLTVKKMPVTVTLSDKEEVVYNGEARTPDLSNGDYFNIKAVDDEHQVTLTHEDFNIVSFNKSMTDVGEYMYSVQFKEFDLSENYSLSVPNYGYLTVTPLVIGVQTGKVETAYDGKAHSNTSRIFNGAVVTGHVVVEPEEFPSITDVGSKLNKYTLGVKDAAGNDVSRNYYFDFTNAGTLEITPCEITVELNVLTGENAYTFTGESIVPDLSKAIVSVSSNGKTVDFIDYGLFKLTFSQNGTKLAEVKNADKYDYSVELNDSAAAKNFTLSATATATLDINPLPVKVTLKDYAFTYSGSQINIYPAEAVTTDVSALTGSDFKLSFKTVKDGAETAVEKLLDSDTYYYTAEIDADRVNKMASNYLLTFVSSVMDGDIARPRVTVSPKEVKVVLKDLTRTYSAADVTVEPEEIISSLGADELLKEDFEITFNDGENEHIDAGRYYLNVALKDETNRKNYKINCLSALLDVKPATATVTLKEVKKTYTADVIKLTATEAMTTTINYGADAPATLRGSLTLADFDVVFDVAVKNAGTYPIKVAIKNAEKVGNYDIKYAGAQYLTVEKAQLNVSFGSFSFVYGEELDITVENAVQGISSISANEKVEKKHLALDLSNVGKKVGTYQFGVTIADPTFANNYEIADGGKGEITITKRAISFGMNDLTVTRREYNEAGGIFDVTHSVFVSSSTPLVNGDTLVFTGVTAEDDGSGYLLINDCFYTLTNLDCYDVQNATSFTAKLTVID